MKIWKKALVVISLLWGMVATAHSTELLVKELRTEWAEARYTLEGSNQKERLMALAKKAHAMNEAHPNDAALLAWEGTILSSYANAKGGLGALSYLQKAKSALEKSISLDEKAEHAQAHCILGVLYYRVPAWPVGFKDTRKALTHLTRAHQLEPQNIDPYYFLGDYFSKAGRLEKAKSYLVSGLNIAPRAPDYQLWNKGRKKEIEQLLSEIKQK